MAGRNFIVAVEHGDEALDEFVRRVAPLARRHSATVIPVDTRVGLSLRDGSSVNGAFEFSGYQYGLERVLEGADPRARVAVAFVNGTARSAHLRPMLPHVLRQAFGRASPAGPPRLIGFRHRCREPRTAVASLGFYVATFAFAVTGEASALRGLWVFDRAAVGSTALARRYEAAGPAYAAEVDAWLRPRSAWRGWYQAVPGQALSFDTLYRKRLTIYLEHALPAWLARQGVDVSPPRGRAAAANDALMLLDRLYVNLLKVRRRVAREHERFTRRAS